MRCEGGLLLLNLISLAASIISLAGCEEGLCPGLVCYPPLAPTSHHPGKHQPHKPYRESNNDPYFFFFFKDFLLISLRARESKQEGDRVSGADREEKQTPC